MRNSIKVTSFRYLCVSIAIQTKKRDHMRFYQSRELFMKMQLSAERHYIFKEERGGGGKGNLRFERKLEDDQRRSSLIWLTRMTRGFNSERARTQRFTNNEIYYILYIFFNFIFVDPNYEYTPLTKKEMEFSLLSFFSLLQRGFSLYFFSQIKSFTRNRVLRVFLTSFFASNVAPSPLVVGRLCYQQR